MAIDYGYEPGVPGALFSNFYDSDSAVMAEDPSSEGGFAVFGKQGEEASGYKAKPSTGGIFMGIAIRNAVGLVKHKGDAVAVCRKGKIWVAVSGDAKKGQPAYVADDGTISATGTTAIGKFATNATKSNGIAVVELA